MNPTPSKYAVRNVTNLRQVAVLAYHQNGGGRRGLEAAWTEILGRVTVRSHDPLEEPFRVHSYRRSYRCPIGDILCIPGAMVEYGSHSPTKPRPFSSYSAGVPVRLAVLDWFERESVVL